MRIVTPGPRSADNAFERVRTLRAGPPLALAIALLLAIAFAVFAVNLGDFKVFYAAAAAARAGVNPYTVPGFYSPLVVLAWFVPLTVLPFDLAFRINALACFLSFVLAFWRIAAGRPVIFYLLLLTPCAIISAWYGNIEYWPVLAAVVNPLAGVWLAIAKPQIGVVLCAVLVLEIARRQSLARAALTGAALAAMLAASYALGMRWSTAPALPWNISLWPWGIPIGVLLAGYALVKLDRRSGLAASAFLSPYLGTVASWVGVLPLASRRRGVLVIVVLLLWAGFLVWRLRI